MDCLASKTHENAIKNIFDKSSDGNKSRPPVQGKQNVLPHRSHVLALGALQLMPALIGEAAGGSSAFTFNVQKIWLKG
jgi:hypothetical protein